MKKIIILLVFIFSITSIYSQNTFPSSGNVGIGITNPQTNLEISSTTSGDAILRIEADTDNNNETDNVRIEFLQDGGLHGAFIGFNNEWGGAQSDNIFRIGTRSGGINNYNNITINPFNDNVGIGTASPAEKLHVNGTTTIVGNIGSITDGAHWQTGKHTLELQNVDAGDVVLSFHRGGYTNAAIKHTPLGGLIINGGGAYNSAHLFVKGDGNIGIGTTTPDSKLSVNGDIHSKKVKVDMVGWSDFVFKNTYNLPTLEEVEKHIQENGHLKDIPSTQEVKENGIYLGEMNAKLLQKIEELTLYTIEQEKKLKEQEEESVEVKIKLAKLEKLVEQLINDKK